VDVLKYEKELIKIQVGVIDYYLRPTDTAQNTDSTLGNLFYLHSDSHISGNGKNIFPRFLHTHEISESLKQYSYQDILHKWDQASLHS
jgi:hypothetical protein